MNADLSWGEVRWREPQPNTSTRHPAVTASTTSAVHPPLAAEVYDDQQGWRAGTFRREDREMYAPKAFSHAQAAPGILNHLEAMGKNRYSPDSTLYSSQTSRVAEATSVSLKLEANQTSSGSDNADRRNSITYGKSELPPILNGPDANEPSSTSIHHNAVHTRDYANTTSNGGTPPSHANILPSFASFQESASCENAPTTSINAASKSDQPSCRGCVEKKSVIDDIAVAVTGLDSTLQMQRYGSIKHATERPQDSVIRTAHWVLDRLQDARVGLQECSPSIGYRRRMPQEHVASMPNRSASPPGLAKRFANHHDGYDTSPNKRQRIDSQNYQSLAEASFVRRMEEQRRASDSIQRGEPVRTYSPAHSDSWTSSAPPRQQSPSFYGGSFRPLPSPSSMATASHKPSWTGINAPPGSSPLVSHQNPPQLHSAPTTSAATQHIADLQHQVTLKSLALQTLQSEYTSLLQKFQRDRLKGQTFEKKCNAADQEVNELTAKNEELSDQVKSLEAQVEDVDKKREAERLEAARQKDQWGKMLEMSGRLQAKNTEEKQKLIQERDGLQQRLTIHENEAALAASRKSRNAQGTSPSRDPNEVVSAEDHASGETNARLEGLQQENTALRKRAHKMREALECIGSQYIATVDKRREIMEQEAHIPVAIAGVLQEDDASVRHAGARQRPHSKSSRGSGRRGSIDASPSQRRASLPGGTETTPHSGAKSAEQSVQHPSSSSSSSPARHSADPAALTTPPRLKLKAVPLPQWQPPSTQGLRAEPLTNNQRRPSGPATPYPGSESLTWESYKLSNERSPSPAGKSSSAQVPLAAFAPEKAPALDYEPQNSSPPKTTGDKAGQNSVSMPPPPRPEPGAAPTASLTGSWRPS